MTRARDIADLVDANGDVKTGNLDNVQADVVDDTTPQLGGDLDTNGNDVNFGENDKAQFGAGNDLQIYHDGYSSKIVDTGTGSLQLGGTSSVDILSGDLGEYSARFHDDGAVELRYDNAIKLETKSGGVKVNGNLRPGDTGTGSLQAVTGQYGSIQVDGGAKGSYEGFSIGGRVVFMHNNATASGIYNDVDNGWMFHGTLGGAAHLYHNGVSKIYTASNGVNVQGTVNTFAEGSTNIRVDLRQGSAKAWALDETLATRTHFAEDSYNLSSTTDSSTGRMRFNINNDMNSSNYSASGNNAGWSANDIVTVRHSASTAARDDVINHDTAYKDAPIAWSVLGDLA